MKCFKFVIFLLIFPTIFFLVYRNSKNPRIRRLRTSFIIAIVATTSLASLSLRDSESTKPFVKKSQIVQEKLISNQEFDGLDDVDGRVILVKTNGNPMTPPTGGPTPGSFLNKPPTSGGQPNPPVSNVNPHLNPFRTAPKLVNQGLGAGGEGNQGGGNNEDGNGEFDENDLVPKKQESQKSKTYDNSFNNKKRKKQSDEQCELDENVKKIEIGYRIEEHSGLTREAKQTNKNQDAQRDINHLIEQLSLGNENPGKGIKKVQGLKKVLEARGKNGGRVYFCKNDGKIEILAISDKGNQKKSNKYFTKNELLI